MEKTASKTSRLIFINKTAKVQQTYTISQLEVLSPYKLYQSQLQYVTHVIKSLNNQENTLIQSPTGSGKTISLLISTLAWLKHQRQSSSNKNTPIRIIYCSRTHAQLKQAVNQLKKTAYKPNIAVLSSRQHSCINESLRQMSNQNKQLGCRLRIHKKNGLNCRFFKMQDYYTRLQQYGRILDIEQVISLGRIHTFCPFFYQKSAQNIADVIFTPYNYLFDFMGIRDQKQNKLNLHNAIIIFDEAHNIPSRAQDSEQYILSLVTVLNALQQLNQLRQEKLREEKLYLNDQHREMHNKTVVSKRQLSEELAIPMRCIQMHAAFLTLMEAKLQEICINLYQEGKVITLKELFTLLTQGIKDNEFGIMMNNLKAIIKDGFLLKNVLLYRPLWAIQAWINFLIKLDNLQDKLQQIEQNFRCQIVPQGSDIKLTIFCLDPAAGFRKIVDQKPYSIIMTSGTLSPLKIWQIQLQVPFPNPLACPHYIRKQQVSAIILSKTPDGTPINFKFENRQNIRMFQQLGIILLDIFKATPNGVIVFFPSYGLLQTIKKHLISKNIFSKLYEEKVIYYEEKNSKNFKSTLTSYLNEAAKPKGAALFALIRGKVSEGLDFSQQKCRAVVMIGVPYPANKDPKIIAKMQYINLKGSKSKEKAFTGSQWYICQTIRAINQSVGRIIRNAKDYGSVYFLDERYGRPDIKGQLPSWIKQHIKIVSSYCEFKQEVIQFHKTSAELFKELDFNFKVEPQMDLISHLGNRLSDHRNSTKFQRVDGSISGKPNQIQISQKKLLITKADGNAHEQINSMLAKIKQQTLIQPKKEKTIEQKIFCRPKKKLPTSQLQQCPICRANKKLIGNTECIHIICIDCWKLSLQKDLRCPICRIRIRQKYLKTENEQN